jgi:nitrogen permease regulator 2-like protein
MVLFEDADSDHLFCLQLSSSFLSDPKSLERVYGIVEQLFEDLNSYCESFVALPVLPHTLFGLKEKSRWQTPPSFVRDRKGSQQSSSGRSGGPIGLTPLSRTSTTSPPLSAAEYSNLSASLSSIVRGMPSSATVRGTFNGSSRNSDAGQSDGLGPDFSRSRSNSSLTGAVPGTIAPLTLTPILEPAPGSRAQERESYFDENSLSPKSFLPGEDGDFPTPLTGLKRPNFTRNATVTAASDTTVGKRSPSEASTDVSSNGDTGMATLRAIQSKALKRNLSTSATIGLADAFSSPLSPSSAADEGSEAPESAKMSRQSSLQGPDRPTVDVSSTAGSEVDVDILAENILTLRKQVVANTATTISEKEEPGVSLPGKREPPHGLGRTVRDAINVKLFPTYANPQTAHDWEVPVALLDLSQRIDSDWDLTMAKVSERGWYSN